MSYCLITAAFNEELFIENTIVSVLAQSLLPELWIIVSDCSSDKTDSIIKAYEKKYSFIKFIRRKNREKAGHNFESKVHALNLALKSFEIQKYDYIGVLDADIILPADYYESMTDKMNENRLLGVGGGVIYETQNTRMRLYDISLNSVIGSIQFIRMECFKQVGEFIPMRYGCEDSMVCIIANYFGWESESFPDIVCKEQKYIGRAKKTLFNARIARGKGFYDMGYHPLFFIVRSIYRMKDKPYILGSLAELFVFFKFTLQRVSHTPSEEYVKFLRKAQLRRLGRSFIDCKNNRHPRYHLND